MWGSNKAVSFCLNLALPNSDQLRELLLRFFRYTIDYDLAESIVYLEKHKASAECTYHLQRSSQFQDYKDEIMGLLRGEEAVLVS